MKRDDPKKPTAKPKQEKKVQNVAPVKTAAVGGPKRPNKTKQG